MNPIIDPMWFYWISVFSNLKTALMIIGFVGGLSCLGYLWYCGDYYHTNPIFPKVLLCICALILVVCIFIPSEETMYKMMIAKYATPNNIEYVINQIIDGAGRIVNALK